MSVDLKELATLIIRGEISGTKRLNLQEFKTLYREVEQAAQAGGRQIKANKPQPKDPRGHSSWGS